MPLPRKKETGSVSAPVLNILRAHVRLTNAEEYTEPKSVTRKSDGATFTLDPQVSCAVEIVDDGQGGNDNGQKFFESFRYKQDDNGEWFNQKNSKLGALTEVVKPGYFEDESIPALTTEDLEGFEMLCRIKPKKNPNTGQTIGSTIDWETMQPLPAARKPVTVPDEDDESDFDNIPF